VHSHGFSTCEVHTVKIRVLFFFLALYTCSLYIFSHFSFRLRIIEHRFNEECLLEKCKLNQWIAILHAHKMTNASNDTNSCQDVSMWKPIYTASGSENCYNCYTEWLTNIYWSGTGPYPMN
jgi:hypothetical protein